MMLRDICGLWLLFLFLHDSAYHWNMALSYNILVSHGYYSILRISLILYFCILLFGSYFIASSLALFVPPVFIYSSGVC